MDRRSFLISAGSSTAFAFSAALGLPALAQIPKKPPRGGGPLDLASYGGGPDSPDNVEPFEQAFEHLVASGGGTLMISGPGRYRFSRGCRELGIAADIGIDVRWGPGVRFIGPDGLKTPLLRFRGSAGPERIGALQLFNPSIDVSQGAYTGNQPSAIHLFNLATVVIEHPRLFGGRTWTNAAVGGDSGIEPTNIGDFRCFGGSIEGFADAGIYWGGGNDPSPVDDGLRMLVEGTTVRHCQTGVIGKRNGHLGIVRDCHIEHCGIGVATAEAGRGQEQDSAQRLDIQGCNIKYSSFRGVEFRGKTIGKIVGNTIEDWGYTEDGETLLPRQNQRCAVFLNGSNDIDVSGNIIRMNDWPSNGHIGIVESNYLSQTGRLFVGGGNYGRENTFVNVSVPVVSGSTSLRRSLFHSLNQKR